ncbi:unnamed protein product [Choristocarpus tenellus]
MVLMEVPEAELQYEMYMDMLNSGVTPHVFGLTKEGNEGGPYLVTEDPGRPLRSLINETSQEGDVTTLEHVFFETLMALKVGHNHGRFHGSVRAENVFIQPIPHLPNRFKVFLVGWGSMYSYGNEDYEEKHFVAHKWATLDGVHSPDERVAIIDRVWKEEANPSTFDAEAADMWGFMAMVMEAFGAADQVGPMGIAAGTGAKQPPAMPSDLWKLLVGLSQKPNNRPTREDVEANHWVCRWADKCVALPSSPGTWRADMDGFLGYRKVSSWGGPNHPVPNAATVHCANATDVGEVEDDAWEEASSGLESEEGEGEKEEGEGVWAGGRKAVEEAGVTPGLRVVSLEQSGSGECAKAPVAVSSHHAPCVKFAGKMKGKIARFAPCVRFGIKDGGGGGDTGACNVSALDWGVGTTGLKAEMTTEEGVAEVSEVPLKARGKRAREEEEEDGGGNGGKVPCRREWRAASRVVTPWEAYGLNRAKSGSLLKNKVR